MPDEKHFSPNDKPDIDRVSSRHSDAVDTVVSAHPIAGGAASKDLKAQVLHNEHLDTPREPTDEDIAERATLQNALHGIPKERLLLEADEFCTKWGLDDHREMFRKGALLAQRPNDWMTIDELSPEERAIVDFEHKHKWVAATQVDRWLTADGACPKGSGGVLRSLLSAPPCKVGTRPARMVQVSREEVLLGTKLTPDLGFPQEFGINRSLGTPGGTYDNWILGLVNSIPYLSAPLM